MSVVVRDTGGDMKKYGVMLLELSGHYGHLDGPSFSHRHVLGVVEAEGLYAVAQKLGGADIFQREVVGKVSDVDRDWKRSCFPFAPAVGIFPVAQVEELVAVFVGDAGIRAFRDLVNSGEPLGSSRNYLCLIGEVPSLA